MNRSAAGGATIVALLGAESTGKTALAEALARELGGIWVPEHLRDWCNGAGRTPRVDEQAAIALAQQRQIEAAAAGHPLVVADTTPLQIAVYSDFVFGDRALYAAALRWQARHVSLTLLTGLDLPWQADGLQRDGPQVRDPVDRRLREALRGAGLPFGVVYGRGRDRVEAALAAVHAVVPKAAPPAVANTAPPALSMPDDGVGARWRPRCLECLDPDCEQALHRRA